MKWTLILLALLTAAGCSRGGTDWGALSKGVGQVESRP